ncbi:protein GLUTAMINE DUMPER 2-like [Typha angustifolia]|uniref:protein GLUTAMINE DUMPER 2-like n=1 Tax=Typha angustifolia TaxID=59011 RepID=UPI003C2C6B0D
MRPGPMFDSPATMAAPVPVAGGGPHSVWHSPVPYLFGGLAAMLGLIALALLILACSYWKLSGYLEEGAREGDDGAGAGSGKPTSAAAASAVCYEEKILVIMAGDEKPTFLATPISSRASSFGDHGKGKDGDEKEVEEPKETGKETRDLNQSSSLREDQSQEV